MKLWKKVSAMVAMAAVCMTMAVPAVASAEVDARIGGCANHDWTSEMVRYEVNTYTHEYAIITENPDGTLSERPGVCTVETTKKIYYKACINCGIIQTNRSESMPSSHSSCGQ